MKKLILLAGVAALASCGEPAATNEAAPEADDTTMESMAAEEESMAGTYDVRWEDGTTNQTVMNEDGTWSSTDADGNAIGGTYAMNEAGQTCFSMEGEEDRCWTDGDTDAEGWISSSDGETTITYRRAQDA